MTKNEKQSIYVSPMVSVMELSSETLVCTSVENLSGNEFDWGNSGNSTESMSGSNFEW